MSARDNAVRLIQYYFRLLAQHSDCRWTSDNDAEVADIVDEIISAVTPTRTDASIRLALPHELAAVRTAYSLHTGEGADALCEHEVYIREHYTTDSPGYQGPVAMIHWGGDPTFITVLVWRNGGWHVERGQ